MKKLILALLMCCSTVAYGQTTTTETTHQIGDDGSIQVTLPFNFTFYNRTFTESWMYDNGIISFVQPGQPNSLSNYQWYAFPLNESNANYYIASLWADIAPVSITKYITQTDGTYMKYIWQDIAEYYSQGGTWRLNTFSTTLRNDGSIETNYTNINLQTSAITVGTVGNLNAGEYNQIYYSPCCNVVTTGMINNWSISGLPPITPTPEPVPQQEIYVAPQYTEEMVSETVVATTPTVIVEPEPIPTTQTTNTTVAITQAATEASPASISTASIVATTTASDSSSNKMSIADAQAIAKNNQKNTDQLVNSIVAGSIENSISLSSTDTETTSTTENTLSAIDSTQSSSINSISSQASSGSIETNVSSSSSSSVTGLANFSRLPGAANTEETTNVTENSTFGSVESIDTVGSDNTTTNLTVETYAIVSDETNPTSVRNLTAMSSLKQLELEEENEKRDIEIADMSVGTTVSELAGTGVELAQLQVLPIGYNIYLSTTLKDSPFYLPKVIYRNQTVVDNAPAQRLLKFASDAKFDQMVSQQYGEQK